MSHPSYSLSKGNEEGGVSKTNQTPYPKQTKTKPYTNKTKQKLFTANMSQFQTASQMKKDMENLMEQTEGDVGMAMSMEMNEKMMKEIEEIKNAYENDMKEIFLNLGSSEFKCYMAVWKASEKPLDMSDMKKQMLSLLEDHMDIVNQFEDGDIKDEEDWKGDLDFDFDDAEKLIALRDEGELYSVDEVEEREEELKEEWEKEIEQKDKVIADLEYSLIHIGEMNKIGIAAREKIASLEEKLYEKDPETGEIMKDKLKSDAIAKAHDEWVKIFKEDNAEMWEEQITARELRDGEPMTPSEIRSVLSLNIMEMEKVCKCFRDIDGDELCDLMSAYGWTNDKGELIKKEKQTSKMTMEDVFANIQSGMDKGETAHGSAKRFLASMEDVAEPEPEEEEEDLVAFFGGAVIL